MTREISPGLDFIILTGFLGSGKTTLLQEHITSHDANGTAVIVNEVGEIGLDGVILRATGSDLPIAMLSNGCLCCAGGGDLAQTIERLLAVGRPDGLPPLRRIVLETSGLSMPGPLLRQLAELPHLRLRVCVVATYDVVRGSEIAHFEEAAAQWAGAHRIVLTKTDLVTEARVAVARDDVSEMNPLAEIVSSEGSSSVFSLISHDVRELSDINSFTSSVPNPRVGVFLGRLFDVPSIEQLSEWFDNLVGALGERLLRLKGQVVVRESDTPVLFESVGTLFSRPRVLPGTSSGSFLVVIARDAELRELEDVQPRGLIRLSRADHRASFGRAQRPARQLKAEAL